MKFEALLCVHNLNFTTCCSCLFNASPNSTANENSNASTNGNTTRKRKRTLSFKDNQKIKHSNGALEKIGAIGDIIQKRKKLNGFRNLTTEVKFANYLRRSNCQSSSDYLDNQRTHHSRTTREFTIFIGKEIHVRGWQQKAIDIGDNRIKRSAMESILTPSTPSTPSIPSSPSAPTLQIIQTENKDLKINDMVYPKLEIETKPVVQVQVQGTFHFFMNNIASQRLNVPYFSQSFTVGNTKWRLSVTPTILHNKSINTEKTKTSKKSKNNVIYDISKKAYTVHIIYEGGPCPILTNPVIELRSVESPMSVLPLKQFVCTNQM